MSVDTWWVREAKHVYGLQLRHRGQLGEMYRHHGGWRIVPWTMGDWRGTNIPAMPVKDAKQVALLLILKAHEHDL